MTTAAIVEGLAPFKRAGVPFASAWSEVVGAVPRDSAHGTESVERSTWRYLRDCYNDKGKRLRLDPSDIIGDGRVPAHGKSREIAA